MANPSKNSGEALRRYKLDHRENMGRQGAHKTGALHSHSRPAVLTTDRRPSDRVKDRGHTEAIPGE